MVGETECARVCRVLIVEHDEAQQRALAGVMEREGFAVTTCTTPAEALAHIEQASFGVVLVDPELPDGEGTRLAEKIHELDCSTRVVIRTPDGLPESAAGAVGTGTLAYVAKAADPDVLVREVYRAFREQMDRYARDLESTLARETTALRETNEALRREINQRKQMEEELRQAHDFLDSLIEHANAPIIVWDPASHITRFNRAFEHLTGYTADEVLGQGLCTLFPGPSREESLGKIARALSGEYWESVEIPIRCKSGETRLTLWNPANIRSEDGTTLLATIAQGMDITERKRAEETLRESEQRFRDIAESMSDWIWEVDADGVYTYCSEKVVALLGYEAEEIIGKTPFDFMPPEEADKVRGLFEEIASNRQPIRDLENWNRTKDGRLVCLLTNGIPVFGENGEFVGYRGVDTDVTDRRQAKQERLAHFRSLESMEQIDQAIRGTVDLDQMMGDVLDASLSIFNCDRAWLSHPCDPDAPAWHVPMERTRPEYPGAQSLGIQVPMDEEVARVLRTVLAFDGPVQFVPESEHPFPSELARQFNFQSQITMAIYPRVGSPWMFGLHQCAYPRVWTGEEERLLQGIGRRIGDSLTSLLTLRDLRESEERFRTLIEQAADAVFLTTTDGKILDVNQRACDSLGYTREELRSMTIAEIDAEVVHQRHRERFWDKLAPGQRFRFEGLHQRKDGTTFPVEVSVGLLELEGQRVMLGLARDITERKQAEEERERLKAELRQAQKMEAVGTLATGVAHDFNNFLTAIMGYTEVARLALPEGSEACQALEGIEQAANQAGGVTQSLLTFSRKGSPKKSPEHLGEVVTESVRLLRGMLPAAIRVVTDVAPTDDLWVDANATQLHQMIVNLAVNARDAMPDGGRLRMSVHHEDIDSSDVMSAVATGGRGAAVFVVEDTGIGMPEEVRARIFEPFFTTKPRERGTGLGMSIVHGIVADHHGRIEVGSHEGRGTRITIAFPCCSPPGTESASSPAARARSGNGELVIVVEDNAQIQGIITSALSSAGYEVVRASDGDEAMVQFDTHRAVASLVILDLDLPKRSGQACLREMRDRRPDIPAIMVTGSVNPELDRQLDDFTRLLRKPFRVRELRSLVSEIIEAHTQQTPPKRA